MGTMKTTMDICLCGPSALEMWRSIDLIDNPAVDVAGDSVALSQNPLRAPHRAPSRRLAVELLPGGLASLSLPIHVLVDDPTQRRRTQAIVVHACSATLPAGSFAWIAERAFCCTPGPFLAQLSRDVSTHRLIRLAFEACGAYALTGDGIRGFRTRPSLLSAQGLSSYVQRARGISGMRHLEAALGHVIGGSASPMETALAMLLSLPHTQGGFGLPKPLLNHAIPLEGRERLIAGKTCYVPDLYWPAKKVAAEYDGANYHSGEAQIASDLRRRNILTSRGITVLTIRKEQVRSWQEFDHLARTLARLLGVRMRIRVAGWERRHEELRREVLGHQG